MSVQHSDWTYTLKRGPRYTRTINGFTYTIFKVVRTDNACGEYHYTKMGSNGTVVYRSQKDPFYRAEQNPHLVISLIEMKNKPR